MNGYLGDQVSAYLFEEGRVRERAQNLAPLRGSIESHVRWH
jgi:hypothetical protein